jgi:hypothetical protein
LAFFDEVATGAEAKAKGVGRPVCSLVAEGRVGEAKDIEADREAPTPDVRRSPEKFSGLARTSLDDEGGTEHPQALAKVRLICAKGLDDRLRFWLTLAIAYPVDRETAWKEKDGSCQEKGS